MTRDEILAMTPGQDLDELVAIKVMGREDNKTEWGQKPFTPSRCIKSAWEVVEKIKKEMQDVTIHDDPYQGCTVTISLMSVGKAPTVPHAICIAALLAVIDE